MPRTRTVIGILLVASIGPFAAARQAFAQGAGGAPTVSSATTKAAEPVADPLLKIVNEAIAVTASRELDARRHSPWQIVHGIEGLRQDLIINVDGERISALEWISKRGATYKGEPYFEVTPWGGRGHPYSKPMIFEGHPTQFLAYMTLSNLPLDYPIKAGDKTITIQDLITGAQKDCKSGDEPGWTLWALVHYLDTEATWTNKDGEPWSIERLLKSQTYENVTTAACGGAHGMFALAYARDKHVRTGHRLTGSWLEADQKIRKYVEIAKSLQNSDGTFSVDYFKGKRAGRTIEERLGPSGHVFEFVMQAIPDERLQEQWVRNAVYAAARDLTNSATQSVSVAPLYHAVSGLLIWRERTHEKMKPAETVAKTTPPATGDADAGPKSPAETPANTVTTVPAATTTVTQPATAEPAPATETKVPVAVPRLPGTTGPTQVAPPLPSATGTEAPPK